MTDDIMPKTLARSMIWGTLFGIVVWANAAIGAIHLAGML
ncbi:MAG: hypothetical protein JWQ03_3106 [Variovorax sp.]|nr:hypothetical protein [Variovorax sp.]